MKIKRSMAVRPVPVVTEYNTRVRLAEKSDYPPDRWVKNPYGGAGWWEKSPWEGEWGYRVTRVTNSVEVRPGFALSKAQVNILIEAGWTVTVLSKG